MEIFEMNLEQVESRMAEMNAQLETAEAPIDGFEEEMRSLVERKAELLEIEQRKATAEALTNGELQPEKIIEVKKVEDRNMFGIETKEYRDAFMAALVGRETVEQRAILADNTSYGDGLSLPVGLDTAIWDQVNLAHPILADVARVNAGMPIKVTKMTPAAVTKKKDSAASTEQTFTGVDVTLVGADYHTYVTLSYAEAKMSQGAMEQFLIREVADALGEALAKDVFAQILSDSAANSVTATTDLYQDVKDALGKATHAARPVIYAPASKYYEVVGAIKSGSPFNMGAALGCEVKLDNAATKVTIVDPTKFVLDIVQETMIEAQRDAKNAQIVIGGYLRAEGCMRNVNAAAFIA